MDRMPSVSGEEWKEVATKGMAAYRAPSLFQPHKVRQAIRDAHSGKFKPLIGFYCGIASLATSRLVAQVGADLVWVDWEHGSCGTELMTDICVYSDPLFDRDLPWRIDLSYHLVHERGDFSAVPSHSHSEIAFALDAGASVVIQQGDTVEQAGRIVEAMKFGNRDGGKRSAPPFRFQPPGYGPTVADSKLTLWQNLKQQAAPVIETESPSGVHNLDAILTQYGEHIDCVWLGALDVRVSLGLEGLSCTEPVFLELVRIYKETLKKHDKPDSGFAWPGSGDMGKRKAFVISAADTTGLCRKEA